MSLVIKKILVSDLRLDPDSEERFSNSKILKNIASKTSSDQAHIFLTAFPIVARKSEKGFVVISGKRSYLLARSLIPENQKIQVTISDATDEDAEIFSAFDDVYAALVFHADLDFLENLATPHVRNRAIFQIANDLSKRDQWRSILQPESKAKEPKLDPSEPGKPKRRGRKLKNAATSVNEPLAKDRDALPSAGSTTEGSIGTNSATTAEAQAPSATSLSSDGDSALKTSGQNPPHGN